MRLEKTSEKILIWMHRENKTQVEIAKELGMTRQTLSARLKDNIFTVGDIIKLQRLGCKLD